MILMSLIKDYELKKQLKKLSSIHGSGTELISVYIPQDFVISDEISKLKDEQSQSSNIKSKTTRLNVQNAIEKMVQYIKLFRKPPLNGLAVFCGNISSEQAKTNIQLFSIEPPQPIKVNIYRCDSEFLLDPLYAMAESRDSFVLVVMDGREATIALLKGTHMTVEKKLRSFAHAKVRKGGASAGRYERAISESINDFYKSVGDSINDVFLKYNFKINGLIVGGPGPTKDNFVKAKVLNYQIKIIGVFDTGYTDEHTGINELLEKTKEVLAEQEVVKEKKIIDRFLGEVANNGLAAFGYEKVKNMLLNNNVTKLIISEDLELTNVKYKCSSCNEEIDAIEEGNARQTRHSCGGSMDIEKQDDAIEEIIEIAEKMNIEIIFISAQTSYGNEFLLGFHGIAALLKYKT